jgi:uncharacterized protein (TIGR02301 family)
MPVLIAPHIWLHRNGSLLAAPLRIVMFAVMIVATLPPAAAQQSDAKPYDERLSRLAEILGAVHYLRELCGSNDGQMWRDRMREIVDGEGASASRRATLARSFNSGYRGYSRTYQTCSPTAQTAINRFMVEGVQIADTLVKSVP